MTLSGHSSHSEYRWSTVFPWACATIGEYLLPGSQNVKANAPHPFMPLTTLGAHVGVWHSWSEPRTFPSSQPSSPLGSPISQGACRSPPQGAVVVVEVVVVDVVVDEVVVEDAVVSMVVEVVVLVDVVVELVVATGMVVVVASSVITYSPEAVPSPSADSCPSIMVAEHAITLMSSMSITNMLDGEKTFNACLPPLRFIAASFLARSSFVLLPPWSNKPLPFLSILALLGGTSNDIPHESNDTDLRRLPIKTFRFYEGAF